jgi:glycine/D-amino acid oxidase-like deaminating enzyme
MNRRELLKLLAAASALGIGERALAANGLRVVVAGAGVVGASIAYHLAMAGASVTVIDKEGPATHASRGTFAWINATWAKQPRSYHELNQQGLANWKELQQRLEIPVRWGGSLEWFDSTARQQKLLLQIAEQREWGEAARMVDASALSLLEPAMNFEGVQLAAFSENDGAVDPVLATQSLLHAAQEMRATVHYPCELNGVVYESGRLAGVNTSRGTIKADRLVLATGAAPDAPKRFAGIDIPQRSTPGVIAITAPMPPLLNRVVAAPGVHMHQRHDGRIVIGEQSGAPQTGAHAARLAARPNSFPDTGVAAEHAARMLSVAVRFLPGIGSAKIEEIYIGWRPLPLDGHPVLGVPDERRDVYLAIMHSGVSLAPIVGQLAAYELIEGDSVERLGAYRPDRSFKLVKRY